MARSALPTGLQVHASRRRPCGWRACAATGSLALSLSCGWLGVTDLQINRLDPDRVRAGVASDVLIVGNGFDRGIVVDLDTGGVAQSLSRWSVSLGSLELPGDSVQWRDSRTLRVRVPSTLLPGVYSASIVSPTGRRGELTAALHVIAAGAGDAGLDTPDQLTSRDAGLGATPDASLDGASGPLPPPCAPTLFGEPERVRISGIDQATYGPATLTDGLHLLFASWQTGREKIYTATRVGIGVTDFGLAQEVPGVNLVSADEGTPFLSADEQTLYFYSTRAGSVGQRDLWYSVRSDAGTLAFAPPEPLVGVNTVDYEHLPSLSADELTLYFASDRARSQLSDLWVARRASRTDAFDSPESVALLNTRANEVSPNLSRDGRTLFFASDRTGDMEIWAATRASTSEPFSPPELLTNLSSSAFDIDPAIAASGDELFFSSGRSGTPSLWRAVRTCP